MLVVMFMFMLLFEQANMLAEFDQSPLLIEQLEFSALPRALPRLNVLYRHFPNSGPFVALQV